MLLLAEALSYCSGLCSKCKVGKKGGLPTLEPPIWGRARDAKTEKGGRAGRAMAKTNAALSSQGCSRREATRRWRWYFIRGCGATSPYLTSEMEPSALKSPVSKINILPHLTKKATAEQHEIKAHLSLNRGSKWHSRERLLPPRVDTCLFRRLTLTARQDLYRELSSRSELCKLPFICWNLCSTLGVVWTPACPLLNGNHSIFFLYFYVVLHSKFYQTPGRA